MDSGRFVAVASIVYNFVPGWFSLIENKDRTPTTLRSKITDRHEASTILASWASVVSSPRWTFQVLQIPGTGQRKSSMPTSSAVDSKSS